MWQSRPMQKVKIKVSRYDIFDYVVGNSIFDPIEKCIDPTKYEVYDTFIYDVEGKKDLIQGDKYCRFEKEMAFLKKNARSMQPNEIDRLCEELEEIAPESLNVD
tara:strand:- start:2696 stop:3007 length:312 start_codon:yes stop_codon:yes gene_type:complete